MMKFFRKYTKHLLAVFMALLLVVWLLEGTLDYFLGPGDADVGHVVQGEAYGQAVRLDDMRPAYAQANLLEALRLPWNTFPQRTGSDGRPKPLTLEEWYMLDAAARRSGIQVPQEQVRKFREQIPATIIESVRNQHKVSLEEIDRAIQAYIRIQEATFAAMQAVKASEADIQDFIRKTEEKARVKLVALDAGKFLEADYQPAPEEMNAQFEKYKANDPAGPGRYGYRLPEEVQVEYIKVDVAELAKSQNISDDEAYTHWDQHRSEFLKPTTQPATSPANREAPKPYETFDDARDAVRRKLQMERARKDALGVARDLVSRLTRTWADAPTTQPGDYRQPPEEALSGDLYPNLIDSSRPAISGALSYERKGFIDQSDFSTLGGFARARAPLGSRDQIGTSEVAFLVPGLEADKEASAEKARFFHNIFETVSEPFVDSEGNAYVFRTMGARPKRVPESLEQVKDQVIADIRLQRAAEKAEEHARQLAERARQVGLEQAVQADAELSKTLGANPVKAPQPFPRRQFYNFGGSGQLYPPFIPEAGMDEEFIETVFSLAGQSTTTQPVRVVVYEPENAQKWTVVELVDTIPVLQSDYEQKRDQAMGFVLGERRRDFIVNWFSPEQIRARVDWKPAQPEVPEQQTAKAGV
ncbi:MAG: hypothetical protein AMXMBFR13_23980 [Phycisphaerae bacterium]